MASAFMWYWRKEKLIMSYDLTALYEKLSHDDELQGKSNNIINQGDIFQGGFLPKDEIPQQTIT